MRKHTTGRTLTVPSSSNGVKSKEDKATKKKRNEWRITQMVLAIFLSYVACYLPITITKVADDDVNYPGKLKTTKIARIRSTYLTSD